MGERIPGLTALRVGSGRASAKKGGGPLGLFRRFRGECGQSTVEFALVLPFLAALMLLFIQFGKAINYWIDLTHVANEAARYASVGAPGSASASAFKTSVCNMLETGELRSGSGEVDAAKFTITYPSGSSATDVGDPIEVKVLTHYHWFKFWKISIDFVPTPIQGSATMRLEQKATGNPALAAGQVTCP